MNVAAMFKKLGAPVAAAFALTAATIGVARADRYDRRFVFHNTSSSTVVEFHATHVDRTGWGRDLLGVHVLKPGDAAIINPDDGSGYCLFDFLSVTANGRRVVERGVDVCTLRTYTLR